MFRFFGAQNVRILNGGLKKWNLESRPLVGGEQKMYSQPNDEGHNSWHVVKEDNVIMDIDYMHKLAFYKLRDQGNLHIVDARAQARFLGEVPEPRKGVRSGHITASQNLPFNELVDPDTGCMKS